MIRATTNSVLKSYKSNLMRSFVTLNKSRDTVLSQRNFLSFAEDPAAASQSFQLRRSFQRVSAQYTNSEAAVRKFETAWTALGSVESAVDTQVHSSAWANVLAGINDPTGSGRAPLGESLSQLAESIVQTMNNKYGDTFTFAGADGLNVPFEWNKDGALLYRGVDVSTTLPEVNMTNGVPDVDVNDDYILSDGTGTITKDAYEQIQKDLDKLKYMSEDEKLFVDIGLGLQENDKDKLVESSAFNSALQGINFLGYGTDEDGDPKNIACIISRMGQLLKNCEDNGAWGSTADQEEFIRLAKKFEGSSANLKEKYVEMDSRASFLKRNHEQLEITGATLNEQFMGIEKCDLADAITSFSWAQYCYNAALKVGNSILSESLMDYMR